jgi:Txe/YoeB family toxin of Txe-Axe toxin-antitoxin module
MEMISWHVHAWEDYLYWQKKDKRIVIGNLIITQCRYHYYE